MKNRESWFEKSLSMAWFLHQSTKAICILLESRTLLLPFATIPAGVSDVNREKEQRKGINYALEKINKEKHLAQDMIYEEELK